MVKNAFYFLLNAFFRQKNFFVLTFFIVYENDFTRKLRLISKFMTSQTGQQIITIITHIAQYLKY